LLTVVRDLPVEQMPRTPLTDSEAQNVNQADDSGVPGPKQLVV